MAIVITVKASETEFYEARLSIATFKRYDNGAMISCGLTVGKGSFKRSILDGWIRRGMTTPITREVYQHSGCLSSCINRGGNKCQW